MPVSTTSNVHFSPGAGTPPGAPTAVTSITKDAGATVSFRAPASSGSSGITSYTVTPYIGATAQAATTVAVASLGAITGSDGNSYLQAAVTGLTNATAYTFTVKASNTSGAGAESAASGANTPLAGLVFGDDFNGPADGPVDPEWWVYSRCGFIAQSEVQWYLPSNVRLDGSSNLQLIASQPGHSGPSYPSDGNTVRSQTWISGACQSNTRTYAPSAGNTMTFETRFQVCPDAGGTMWPGLLWLEGYTYLDAWKTDPAQSGWDSTGKAEIDIAEWNQTGLTGYYSNVATGGFNTHSIGTSIDFSAAMHVFSVKWKPGATTVWLRDGAQTVTDSSAPASGCSLFLLLYLQIYSGPAANPQHCSIDYVRVFDLP